MGQTLLELVQAATTELGLPTPQFVIRSADNTGRQFGGLANRIGDMLIRMNDWTFQVAEFHITVPGPVISQGSLTLGSTTITNLDPGVMNSLLPKLMVVSGQGIMQSVRLLTTNVAGNSCTIDQPATLDAPPGPTEIQFRQDAFPIPADFSRSINRTQWDRTMRWELRGPQSPQWDQWVRSGIVSTGPRRMYRELDNCYRIWPAPSPTDTPAQLIAEYVSNFWATGAGGTPQRRFQADQDTCVWDDDVMIMGLKMLFFQAKGFDYSALQADWMKQVGAYMAFDGGAATLDMSRRKFPIFISPANIQDADFPSRFGNP